VNQSNPFYNDIAAMQESGILNGFSNGTYGPYEHITRAQMAAVLDRAFGLANMHGVAHSASSYTDVNVNGAFYKSIQSLYIIDQTPVFQTSTYRGSSNATRADFSAAVYSSMNAN